MARRRSCTGCCVTSITFTLILFGWLTQNIIAFREGTTWTLSYIAIINCIFVVGMTSLLKTICGDPGEVPELPLPAESFDHEIKFCEKCP